MMIKPIPSLDGIRALSVGVVLLSHAGLGNIVPGGFGVTVFFFLSGYLITTLLLAEQEKMGKINLSHFYLRRFFRLFPPLFFTLLFSYFFVFSGYLSGGVSWGGALSQFFYMANYHQIFNWPGEIPSGTGILWSLAVEEHFYLFFPVAFCFLIKKFNRKSLSLILFLTCLLILSWRCLLFFYFNAPESRTYYSSDTRIDSILFGCVLALLKNPVDENVRQEINIKDYLMIITSFALILFSFIYRDESFRETFRYTLQGVSLAPLFYYSVKYYDSYVFKFLNFPVLKKIGVYSYFIYLIHFIIIHILKENGLVDSTMKTILYTSVLSLVYSILLDRYFDSYFKKLRKRYRC